MGITDVPVVDWDTTLVEHLIELYEGMGNQIALQYAGSELVNTIKTYRSGKEIFSLGDFSIWSACDSHSISIRKSCHPIARLLDNSQAILQQLFHGCRKTRLHQLILGKLHTLQGKGEFMGIRIWLSFAPRPGQLEEGKWIVEVIYKYFFVFKLIFFSNTISQ